MNVFVVKVLKKINAFKLFNFSVKTRINNKGFKIPISDNIGYSNLTTSEPWMLDVLKVILPLGEKRFFDIGVNTGQTLLKLKSVSAKIEYVGFEPNPFCVGYTSKLINKNNFKNTTLIPVGISNKTEVGQLHFIENSNVDSAASIIPEYRQNNAVKSKTYIPLFNVECLKSRINFEGISILKVDVEGAELEVLTGFQSYIAKSGTIILLEILPAYNKKNTFRISRQNKILELLKTLNYIFFRVVKQNDLLINFEAITEIGIHEDLSACDYVVVPKAKIEDFKRSYKQILKK